MPEKMLFTMAKLAGLKPFKTGRRTVYDKKLPGLALTITETGGKSFYLYGRFGGRPRRVRISGFPELSVEDARAKARKLIARISEGDDPNEAKRRQRGELTLGQLFDLYLEVHATAHKKASSVATDKATFQRYMTGWQSRKLSSISHGDIQQLHAKVGKANGKYAANRLLALLSKMFNEATNHGEWKYVNPCRGVKKFAEKSRDRFLQPEEIPRFLKAVDSLENRQAANVFQLMLLTGARKGNVLAMRWEDIAFDSATWRIPDTKANEPQRVHLPTQAVEILTAIKTTAGESPYVFPGRTAGGKAGHVQDITTPWRAVCDQAELPGLRMHNLRRSLGSWMAAGGTSLPIIGKALGHHDQQTTTVHARLNLDPVRSAVDSAVSAMLSTTKPAVETSDDLPEGVG